MSALYWSLFSGLAIGLVAGGGRFAISFVGRR